MNKLVFLGTGNAANLERYLTSLYFHIDDKDFLIDCGDGMGTVRNFLKAGGKLEALNDIFITHRHADHVIGLAHLVFLLLLDPKKHVHIYGPEEALKIIQQFATATHDHIKNSLDRIDFVPLSSHQKVNISNNIEVSSTEVRGPISYSISCFAYAIKTKKTKIVFTGDMQPSQTFEHLATNTDIMVHECFGLDILSKQIHEFGHSTAKDAGVAATKAHAKRLILTHLGMKKDIGSGEKFIEEASKFFSGKITIAEDLMEIEL